MRPGCRRWHAWSVAMLSIALCSVANTEAAAQFGGGGPQRDYDYALAFSGDGQILAGGGPDKLRFWDARTGELLRTVALPVPRINSIAFAPRSRTLYTGGDDGRIYTCDAETGELKRTVVIDAARVKEIAFLPELIGNLISRTRPEVTRLNCSL